jgi:hypothetical protein
LPLQPVKEHILVFKQGPLIAKANLHEKMEAQQERTGLAEETTIFASREKHIPRRLGQQAEAKIGRQDDVERGRVKDSLHPDNYLSGFKLYGITFA